MKKEFLTEEEVKQVEKNLYQKICEEKKNDEVSIDNIFQYRNEQLEKNFKKAEDSIFNSEEVKNSLK